MSHKKNKLKKILYAFLWILPFILGTIGYYIEEKRLDKWVHNKTIQKARESYRITGEQKEYLKGLKV